MLVVTGMLLNDKDIILSFRRCLLPVHKDNRTSGFPVTIMGEGEIIEKLRESTETD